MPISLTYLPPHPPGTALSTLLPSSSKHIFQSIAGTLPLLFLSRYDSPSKVQVKVGFLFLDINKVISPSSEILQKLSYSLEMFLRTCLFPQSYYINSLKAG